MRLLVLVRALFTVLFSRFHRGVDFLDDYTSPVFK
jgi:hypothetical protein